MTTQHETKPIPRTENQILQRLKEIADADDMFGVERSRLLEALSWQAAQSFLQDGHDHEEAEWEDHRLKTTGQVIDQIVSYLGFAWGKANESRGLSAQRSLAHFRGLLYLLGSDHDELRQWIGSPEHYQFYGKPQLVKVSEVVGFDWRTVDNDEWKNAEDADDVLTADEALAGGD
jgi:hypothetical protein